MAGAPTVSGRTANESPGRVGGASGPGRDAPMGQVHPPRGGATDRPTPTDRLEPMPLILRRAATVVGASVAAATLMWMVSAMVSLRG